MKILLLAVGKKHDSAIADAILDYTARLERYGSVQWRIIPPHKLAAIDAQRTAESQALLKALKPDDTVVLLDERGLQFSTPQLADFLAHNQQHARRLVFVIGGAYGVDEHMRVRANYVWALSKLVFPHQLVRLILAEQLYRAHTILRGEPYHHQ